MGFLYVVCFVFAMLSLLPVGKVLLDFLERKIPAVKRFIDTALESGLFLDDDEVDYE